VNLPINRENLRDALIGLAIASALALWLGACASQPPPPIVVAAPTPAPTPIPKDPYADLSPDVADAIKHNQTPTFQHGITLVYPYSPDLQYPVNCQPLHVTEIRLRPDEWTSKENVKVGDKDRWGTIVGDHTVLLFPTGTSTSITVAGAQIRIPGDPNMVTNLVIHTSAGHDYIFNPVRIHKPLTQAIEFYYPDEVRAQEAQRDAALKITASQSGETAAASDPPPTQQQRTNK
jgi:type IV secretory pathway VirB9-like protein